MKNMSKFTVISDDRCFLLAFVREIQESLSIDQIKQLIKLLEEGL